MDSLIESITKQGGYAVFLVIVLYGFWLFVKSRLQECKEERLSFTEERKQWREEFNEAIDRRDIMINELHEKTLTALDSFGNEFRALREEIKGAKHD